MSKEMGQCYTIGHSTRPIARFMQLLERNGVNCVVDVRSQPYSRFAPQYNRETLRNALKEIGNHYIYMGKELGARHHEPHLLFPDGKVDFEKVRQSLDFQDGIRRLLTGLSSGYRIALMCSEYDPFDCHRFVLVSHELGQRGVEIAHIYDASKVIPHSQLEERLLQTYGQLDLFGDSTGSRDQELADAYRQRNREIAYVPVEEAVQS